jgi:hypothetical protein
MRPVHRADNLTTFMCRLSRNLGALTSWTSKGLSRRVMGLLYLFPKPQTKYNVRLLNKSNILRK